MSLTDSARCVLTALQTGCLELAEQPIEDLRAALAAPVDADDAHSAALILREARIVTHAHRSHLLHSLQQVSRESLYSEGVSVSSSAWQLQA